MALVFVILGFIWWWPIGLLILGFMFARGKLGPWRHQIYAGEGQMFGRVQSGDRWERKAARMQEKVERMRDRMERFKSRGGDWFGPASSGNRAFDDYRMETLKRLEDEQREFQDFLGRLREAKDRAEFDQFMADRRERPAEPMPPAAPSPN